MKKLAKLDSSKVYETPFYGILNANGDFWGPDVFNSEAAARKHMDAFWGHLTEMRDQCRRTHKIVPVRVRLDQLPPPASPTRPTEGDGN
jgi:hypothetical protein